MIENYIGIFEDKSLVTKKTLNEILLVYRVKYVFKSILQDNFTCYHHINRKGENSLLKIGKFEIIDFGRSSRTYFNGRDIRIAKEGEVDIHIFKSQVLGSDFIQKELFPTPFCDQLKFAD
jgi:hypothetical protein